MSFYFADQSWPQLKEAIDKNTLIILPVGTTEEHGQHLPVSCDAMIARAYGDELGKACEGKVPVLVMETINYGFSMKTVRRWPGCPNINTRTFIDYIYDIVASVIEMGFEKVVLLDCHGNHDCLLRTVMREIADKYDKYIMTLSPSKLSAKLYDEIKKDPAGDIHGGEYETSMILHINPSLVDTTKYTSVDAVRCNSPLRGPVSTWGLQDTKTGLYGDPTTASAETGRLLMEEAVKNGVMYLQEFYNWKFE